jgi:D-alanyl-lipoteichoic acid acyltransferase DltB (MBOAT superfamily)
MLFNSLNFLFFLPVVFILYWVLSKKGIKFQNILLLIASYFFYSCWDYRFLFLLIFSTFLDYFTGLKIFNSNENFTKKALENFQELTRIYPNSMLVKVFFNAKYREIIEIFKGAPTAEQTKAIDLLSKMDPANKSFYDQIKT